MPGNLDGSWRAASTAALICSGVASAFHFTLITWITVEGGCASAAPAAIHTPIITASRCLIGCNYTGRAGHGQPSPNEVGYQRNGRADKVLMGGYVEACSQEMRGRVRGGMCRGMCRRGRAPAR